MIDKPNVLAANVAQQLIAHMYATGVCKNFPSFAFRDVMRLDTRTRRHQSCGSPLTSKSHAETCNLEDLHQNPGPRATTIHIQSFDALTCIMRTYLSGDRPNLRLAVSIFRNPLSLPNPACISISTPPVYVSDSAQ